MFALLVWTVTFNCQGDSIWTRQCKYAYEERGVFANKEDCEKAASRIALETAKLCTVKVEKEKPCTH